MRKRIEWLMCISIFGDDSGIGVFRFFLGRQGMGMKFIWEKNENGEEGWVGKIAVR